ncbi:putative metallophosphoesterase [Roseimaritima multifibrata]|uniref:Putative metallophosphoesterase n=1 Tax=Roseimaritima multifibrata TaxID=1930274 RepID=A0A517ML04_9BACT|nr:metallophosphoesterase [Roseimaritima multifibrata]QDS95559.1 putative metallophosphoesterase [Roseimaritima multifibrata]
MEAIQWQTVLWWVGLCAAIIGHGGLYVALYNRLNACGLPRKTIKRFVWLLLSLCLLTPLFLVWCYEDFFVDILFGQPLLAEMPKGLAIYAFVCLTTWIYPGLGWFWSRPILGVQRSVVRRHVRRISVNRMVPTPLALTPKCRFESRWPGNQIFELAVEEKELQVPGLPPEWDGFKIAHLSDIHLTGHVATEFFRYAVEQANAWNPDIVALTGDIVDYDKCLGMIQPSLQSATAKYGKFFVLGNHDTRVSDPVQIRQAMEQIGWQDLGGREVEQSFGSRRIQLIGNEAPWFPAPVLDPRQSPSVSSNSKERPRKNPFRLALCHSPDRIEWAREHHVTLMLAGHTHGGQGRLPLIGPVLSPSWYGSRFASGEFYLPPTTLHVSRGLSGVHLLRIMCPPELALLVLRATSVATVTQPESVMAQVQVAPA